MAVTIKSIAFSRLKRSNTAFMLPYSSCAASVSTKTELFGILLTISDALLVKCLHTSC